MNTVIFCLILIPLLGQIVMFWAKAVKWAIRNQRSFGKRLQRFRSAVADACEEE
jgi:hypothetical protein